MSWSCCKRDLFYGNAFCSCCFAANDSISGATPTWAYSGKVAAKSSIWVLPKPSFCMQCRCLLIAGQLILTNGCPPINRHLSAFTTNVPTEPVKPDKYTRLFANVVANIQINEGLQRE